MPSTRRYCPGLDMRPVRRWLVRLYIAFHTPTFDLEIFLEIPELYFALARNLKRTSSWQAL